MLLISQFREPQGIPFMKKIVAAIALTFTLLSMPSLAEARGHGHHGYHSHHHRHSYHRHYSHRHSRHHSHHRHYAHRHYHRHYY